MQAESDERLNEVVYVFEGRTFTEIAEELDRLLAAQPPKAA